MTAMKRLIPTALLGLAVLLTGCAGGLRGGAAPEAGSSALPTPSAKPAAQAAPAAPAAAAEGVTFVWKGEGESVSLAGDFNSWNTTADPMKKQTDGSWTITKKLEPGKHLYKFVLDGGKVWKEDPGASESVDDGQGGKNSVLVVGGAAGAPVPPTAPRAKAVPAGTGPTAEAGGVTFVWKGEGESVSLAGEFNSWNTTADPMVKQADGSWTITKKLEPGRYPYKFVLDGGRVWKEDPGASESVDDGQGGKNSVLVVGGGATSLVAAPVPPATSTAPAGKGKAPVQTPDGVVFTYAGAATSVALAGDFNTWAMAADPLTKQADGSWTITKKLAAGTYEYKFVVDGATWKTDEANPESKADPYGGKNSLVTVK
jgi:1,4-alpha-glucan branching enzyme